jgi:hypothetical protein
MVGFLAKGPPHPRPPAVAVAPANRKKAALRMNPRARRAYDKELAFVRHQQRMREWVVQRTLDVSALRQAINPALCSASSVIVPVLTSSLRIFPRSSCYCKTSCSLPANPGHADEGQGSAVSVRPSVPCRRFDARKMASP